MAKKSSIEKVARRRRTVAKYAERRAAMKAELKDVLTDQLLDDDQRREKVQAIRMQMQLLPRDANPNRIKNRCLITGRARAVYRKFGISRLKFREMALWGLLPGVRKASW